jgi:hypothetical protein
MRSSKLAELLNGVHKKYAHSNFMIILIDHTLCRIQLDNVNLQNTVFFVSVWKTLMGSFLAPFGVPDVFCAHLLLLSFKLCIIVIVMPMDFQCNFTVAMQTGFVSYWMFHVSCLVFVINH